MDFVKGHIILVLISLGVSFLLFYIVQASGVIPLFLEKSFMSIKKRRISKPILIFIGLLFIAVAYISKPIFYFPYNVGVAGDDYCNMGHAMAKQNYTPPPHPLWPLLGEKAVVLLEKLNILKESDPLYYEKAFLAGSLPVRVSMGLALICTFIVFLVLFNSFYVAAVAFFTIGFSYAPWIWGIQSNAMGLGISFEIFAFFLATLFWKTKNNIFLILLGIFTGLCVFAHNSLGYFAVGVFLAVLYGIFILEKGVRTKNKITQLLCFVIPSALMALQYYFLESRLFGTHNIFLLLSRISDRSYFADYSYFYGFRSIHRFLIMVKDLVVITLFNIMNYPNPINIVEKIEIAFSMVGITTCLMFLINTQKEVILKLVKNPIFVTSVITYLCIGFGFFATSASPHYFSILAIPTLFGGCIALFTSGSLSETHIVKVFLFLIILNTGLATYNVFSNRSVFQGINLSDNKVYSQYVFIEQYLKDKQPAVFITANIDFAGYRDEMMLHYYSNKFNNIERVTSFPSRPDKLVGYIDARITKAGANVFVDDEVKNILEKAKSRVRTEKIGDSVNLIENK